VISRLLAAAAVAIPTVLAEPDTAPAASVSMIQNKRDLRLAMGLLEFM
jgi:hypothetical protein